MASKSSDVRPKITLACTECKERNYITKKNRRNNPRPHGAGEVLPALPHPPAAPRDPLNQTAPALRPPASTTEAGSLFLGARAGHYVGRMTIDQTLVGREFPPTRPYPVTRERLEEFAASAGDTLVDDRAPATFPIVLAFEAMTAFLADTGLDLWRIVHGEQRFAYERAVVAGDVLTATLSVVSLRQIGGNDIIGTSSAVTDEAGALVCSTTATLVHRGAES